MVCITECFLYARYHDYHDEVFTAVYRVPGIMTGIKFPEILNTPAIPLLRIQTTTNARKSKDFRPTPDFTWVALRVATAAREAFWGL
ncbi:hypothetical protein AAY473_019459 [Plecturocebus cupreus]